MRSLVISSTLPLDHSPIITFSGLGRRSGRGSGAGAKATVSTTNNSTNRRMDVSPRKGRRSATDAFEDLGVPAARPLERGRPRLGDVVVRDGQRVALDLVDPPEHPAGVRPADAAYVERHRPRGRVDRQLVVAVGVVGVPVGGDAQLRPRTF